MKHNVGDKVLIKSLDWYNKNKDANGDVLCFYGVHKFTKEMSKFCNKTVTISTNLTGDGEYLIKDDDETNWWTDAMIEGLTEEEVFIKANDIYNEEYSKGEYCHEQSFKWGFQEGYNYSHENDKLEISLKEGYQFKDEDGNVINATKIVLEKKPDDKLKLESTKKVREYWSEYARIYIEIYDDEPNECVLTHLYTLEGHRQKGYGRQALIEAESIAKELGCHTAYLKVETNSWMHEWYLRMGYKWYKTADKEYTWLVKNLTSIEEKKKEYPKTYCECKDILGLWDIDDTERGYYKTDLIDKLQMLLICRDAYWKIAGEEMGLDESWELSIGTPIYYIYYNRTVGTIKNDYADDIQCNIILAFPTEEMRDAFKENFKELIESCKELL